MRIKSVFRSRRTSDSSDHKKWIKAQKSVTISHQRLSEEVEMEWISVSWRSVIIERCELWFFIVCILNVGLIACDNSSLQSDTPDQTQSMSVNESDSNSQPESDSPPPRLIGTSVLVGYMTSVAIR